jgi:tetratricopeptide (TPR) repeat protein
MPDNAGLDEFKQGIELLRKGHSARAVECFRHATELKQQNPFYISFLGVAMARAQGQWAAAVELCKKAVSLKRTDAQLYLNLAEVYVSAGRRDIAVETLDAASRYCAADARIGRMRGRLGRRSSPVLPFIDRGNPLNRSLGKLRHRVVVRVRRAIPAFATQQTA